MNAGLHDLAASLLWIIEILCLLLIALGIVMFIVAMTISFVKAIATGVGEYRTRRRLKRWLETHAEGAVPSVGFITAPDRVTTNVVYGDGGQEIRRPGSGA